MVRDIFKIGIVFFNILAVIALLISVSGQYISPEKGHIFAYLGMFFFPLAIINCCFVLFWAGMLKWHFLISFICILLFTSTLKKTFSIIKKDHATLNTQKTIKILSYNVMLFNYYTKNSKILDYIENDDADIVCLQEFGWYKKGHEFLAKKDILSHMKKYPYHYINIALDGELATYGIATFSKYPIVNKEKIEYVSAFNSSVYTDIKIGKDTIRLFNNHLESNRLTKKDKANLIENTNSSTISLAAQKLGFATAIRAKQAKAVAKSIKESPYQVIVCGDFNDIPVSYTYKQIANGLTDTFIESGSGLGITFHDQLYRFRIDYILLDKSFGYSNYLINNKIKSSDHYPVSCTVALN